MNSVVPKTATEQEFFQRGRALACRADASLPLPEERTVSFEDPAELPKLLTARRLEVFQAVRDEPTSITGAGAAPAP